MTPPCDDREFARWYGLAADPVLRRVAAKVGDRALAREASAEAFARAYERWGRVRGLDSPEAWVVTVATNLCRRSWRRRRLEARALARVGVAPVSVEPASPPDEDLLSAVDALPDRMRTAVHLRYWGDLPEREVARRMDIAPGTASALLSQARRRLGAGLPDHRSDDHG